MLDLSKIGSKLYNDFVEEFNVHHFLKLLIIVGGYVLFRYRALDFIRVQQLKNQINDDNKRKAEGLIDRPEDFVKVTPVDRSEQSWGWGKSTRRKVRAQEKLFEEKIEQAALRAQNKGYDSDDELRDILED